MDLRGADLHKVDLRQSILSGTNLNEARLQEADLTEAYLWAVELSRANLLRARLLWAKLGEADLSHANLAWTNLRGANLIRASLAGANLLGADLGGALFVDATVDSVTLRGADLTIKQLASATYSVQVLVEQGLIRSSSLARDTDPARTIIREIEFPPEYHQTGLSILEYFGTVVRQKYPDTAVKVRIEQEGLKVRMVIETPEGKKEPIEKTLTEYGLVVVGEKKPAEFLTDKFHVMRLENRLEQMKMQHGQDQKLLAVQHQHTQEIGGRYDQLLKLLGDKLLQQPDPPTVVISIEGFPQLKDSLSQSEQLTADQRREALDLLEKLREQTELAEKDRLDKSTLRKMYDELSQFAGIASAATSIWQVWGPRIASLLGLLAK